MKMLEGQLNDVLHWIQIKSLCTYARQEEAGKKQNLCRDKTYNPSYMREVSYSLEYQFIDILVQIKFIFISIWPAGFNPLFYPRVGDKNGPLSIFCFKSQVLL